MKTYVVRVKAANGEYELEGIFTSLKEVSSYLEIPKTAVTAIFNHRYDAVDASYRDITIDREYNADEYSQDLTAEDEEEVTFHS